MKYYFGIDGGGTKTHCYIGDEKGNILGEGFGGRCNYQICGINEAKNSIITALYKGLEMSTIKLEQLSYGVLGLSGADEACDFEVLNKACVEILGDISFDVVNDTWIGLRTGAEYGVISICGTGAAHAGVNKEKQHEILRNIDFETGNRGGGSEVVSKALHYAFRSNEGTYTKSLLEDAVLNLFGLESMDEVCTAVRNDNISSDINYNIPKITLELATKGDTVAKEIIVDMGSTEGMYAAALVKKLGLENEKVPMVLIGGLFQANNKILIDSYIEEVHKIAPLAYVVIPKEPPVLGALLLAIGDK